MAMESPDLLELVAFFNRLPACDRKVLRALLGDEEYEVVKQRVAEGRQQSRSEPTSGEALSDHLSSAAEELLRGELIPFLGAAASTWHRGSGVRLRTRTDFGGEYVPTADELAGYILSRLPESRPFPDPARAENLLLVAQWLQLAKGKGRVTRVLREVFNIDRPPTPLHRFLAKVPELSRQYHARIGMAPTYPIYFTTNYDDLLSRALIEAEEPFDVLSYIAEGKGSDGIELAGMFRHYTYAYDPKLKGGEGGVRRLSRADCPECSAREGRPHRHEGLGPASVVEDLRLSLSPGTGSGRRQSSSHFGVGRAIRRPETYTGPFREERPVIIKVHGAVDRSEGLPVKDDSYVVTEDDYLDFLPRTRIDSLFPNELVSALRASAILFLGYGLRDWNLRAIIRILQEDNELDSYAVQLDPDEIERFFWEDRKVAILNMGLDRYVPEVVRATEALVK